MTSESVGVIVLGAGTVGRALVGQISAHRAVLAERLALRLEMLAVTTSRLWALPESGAALRDDVLQAIAREGITAAAPRPYTLADLLRFVQALPRPAVVVDASASDGTVSVLASCLAARHHVVLANKKPLAGDASVFAALMRYRTKGRAVRYEATVGAGLPVIRTLQDMVETGDEIMAIDATLSGTLGYITTELEDGVPFSRAVRAAHAAGYTEPDPRDDLSGRDVARKAVILARTCGFQANLDDMTVAGLGDLGAADAPVQQFLDGLDAQDGELAARVAEAHAVDQVLRYVARVTPQGATAGLTAVPRDHPLARLRGTASLIAITSTRYRESPLVISGAGAGAAVTAAGIYADIVSAATMR